jgi:hypothetical protein
MGKRKVWNGSKSEWKLKLTVAGVSPQKFWFSPRAVPVEFGMDRVALRKIFLRALGAVSSWPLFDQMLHIHICGTGPAGPSKAAESSGIASEPAGIVGTQKLIKWPTSQRLPYSRFGKHHPCLTNLSSPHTHTHSRNDKCVHALLTMFILPLKGKTIAVRGRGGP